MIVAAFLDRLAPWAGRIAWIAALIAAVAFALLLTTTQCSRQEAAQSKQDARSAQAGTKTAGEALDTLDRRYEQDAGIDATVEEGRQNVAKAKQAGDDAAIDAAGRDALCRMSKFRDNPACRVQSVHP